MRLKKKMKQIRSDHKIDIFPNIVDNNDDSVKKLVDFV